MLTTWHKTSWPWHWQHDILEFTLIGYHYNILTFIILSVLFNLCPSKGKETVRLLWVSFTYILKQFSQHSRHQRGILWCVARLIFLWHGAGLLSHVKCDITRLPVDMVKPWFTKRINSSLSNTMIPIGNLDFEHLIGNLNNSNSDWELGLRDCMGIGLYLNHLHWAVWVGRVDLSNQLWWVSMTRWT